MKRALGLSRFVAVIGSLSSLLIAFLLSVSVAVRTVSLIVGTFPWLELENVTVNPSVEGYVVGLTAYSYGKTDGAANIRELQRRLEQVVGGPVTLRARVILLQLGVVNSTRKTSATGAGR